MSETQVVGSEPTSSPSHDRADATSSISTSSSGGISTTERRSRQSRRRPGKAAVTHTHAHSDSQTRTRWAARIGALALVAAFAVAAATHQGISVLPVSNNGELVVNGGFENGTTGWRVNNKANESLSVGSPGRSSRGHAGVVLAIRSGVVALNDAQNTVIGTKTGTSYMVSAWLRSTTPGVLAQLRIREVQGDKLVAQKGQVAKLGSTWQRVSLPYTTASTGAKLDLNVIGWNVPGGYGIEADDISMRAADPAARPAPSATVVAPSPPAATPGPVSTSVPAPSATQAPAPPSAGGSSVIAHGRTVANCLSARGIPSCGTFFGTSIQGNADPASLESKVGKLSLHRTYYQSSQVAGAIRTAKADLAADRLPWISFKPPYSWPDMIAGKGDAWAKDLAKQLSNLNGPVWLAIHHEPENDGDITQWTKMQAHLAPMIRSIASNVAYSIITTGWNQVGANRPEFSLDSIWPGDGIIDIVAFDPYNPYGQVKNGKQNSNFTELKHYYDTLAPFAQKHHTHWGIAETGYTDAAAAKDPQWLNRAYSDMESMGGVGLSYFNSNLNSSADWQLNTSTKMSAFKSTLSESIRMS